MKIKRIRIENFRSFLDQTITFNKYTCFVGPNGAGKSTVLSALNVFFKEQSASATDVTKLGDEDYFEKNTQNPIRITVVFDELNEAAAGELSAYYRNGELAVSAEATFDPSIGFGQVKHYGQRLGFNEFRPFFEAIKTGARAAEINQLYDQLKTQFPDLPNARSKEDKQDALRAYESSHQERCVVIPSEDLFYGINSTGKLANFIQWVYVPAVKDACEEGQEAKNTALGKLIARAVNTRANFESEIAALKADTLSRYRELLARNQANLTTISQSLQRRLESWAHPNVRLGVAWISDPDRSVVVQQPVAGIQTGEGGFLGSLSRMGHGLQRSYLLALLQELADSDSPEAPTLILGCEEPELYQHPPQARHLADIFDDLSSSNNQILVTTHSPLFLRGDGFEFARLVRKGPANTGASVKAVAYPALCQRIRAAVGDDLARPPDGLIAKIHQALQPGIAEMFFARIPILVEGLEDVSYITAQLFLSGLWSEYRRLGCHLIPAGGKDRLVQPLAIAKEFNIPIYIVFDADRRFQGGAHEGRHVRDNQSLARLLEIECSPFPPQNITGPNHTIWAQDLGEEIKADFGESYNRLIEHARVHFGHEGGLEKHDLFIAHWLTFAKSQNLSSAKLSQLCESIIAFARNAHTQ